MAGVFHFFVFFTFFSVSFVFDVFFFFFCFVRGSSLPSAGVLELLRARSLLLFYRFLPHFGGSWITADTC